MNIKAALTKASYKVIQGNPDMEVEDVVYDSRKAGPGCVFVCMVGAVTDSHRFFDQVVSQGCSAVVIERPLNEEQLKSLPENVTVLQAEHSRQALALLSAARFDYPAKRMICIGVTGTKGKTTATYMIKAILERDGKKAGLIGTAGAVIGDNTYPTRNTTPESYELHQYFAQMVKEGCDYMIMEVSSQGLKMHRVDGIEFDYAIFTNISLDHVGPNEHESFKEYLYYKSQLFNQCKVGILNRDDPHFEEVLNHIRKENTRLYTYGLETEADFKAKEIQYVSKPDFVGLDFQVQSLLEAKPFPVRVNIPGKFNVSNAMAAVCVCCFLNIPRKQMNHALEHLYVNGRMEIVYSSKRCTVLVDYAHNAVSMESLLLTLRDYHPKRLVCVFGCGGNRSKDRRYSMGEIGGKLADLCILTADNSRDERVEDILTDIRGSIEKTGGAFIEIPDRKEAIEHSIIHSREGDMIAVIGKGHEDYQEICGVRYPFLDRQVIEEVVKKLESGELSWKE